MNLYKRFKMNPDLESKKGVVLDYGNGMKVTVLRAGGSNKEFQQALREALLKTGRRISTMSDEESVKNMVEIYADTVVKGWEGLTDENDQEIPFNRENIIKVLTELPEFYADIQQAANSVELFREYQKAALVGK